MVQCLLRDTILGQYKLKKKVISQIKTITQILDLWKLIIDYSKLDVQIIFKFEITHSVKSKQTLK